MTDEPDEGPDRPQPIHGQVRYSQVSARVPEDVGAGHFASAVMVMTGPFEHVLDFILRLSEAPRVVARVVLSPAVVRQFARALQQNIANYEGNFGPLPRPPQLIRPPQGSDVASDPDHPAATGKEPDSLPVGPGGGQGDAPPWTTHPPDSELTEPSLVPPAPPNIEQIYDELRLPDAILSGRYANAVLIRHSSTEFCFDFITNIYPRSSVSARVYMAAANVSGLLQSLQQAIEQRPK